VSLFLSRFIIRLSIGFLAFALVAFSDGAEVPPLKGFKSIKLIAAQEPVSKQGLNRAFEPNETSDGFWESTVIPVEIGLEAEKAARLKFYSLSAGEFEPSRMPRRWALMGVAVHGGIVCIDQQVKSKWRKSEVYKFFPAKKTQEIYKSYVLVIYESNDPKYLRVYNIDIALQNDQ